jgi:hypothetical protein
MKTIADPLIIIPCGSAKIWRKKPHIGPVEARDAYVGTPFKVNRAYAERFASRWLILSAKYGFIDPGFQLPGPYEVTFKSKATSPISSAELLQQAQALKIVRAPHVIGLGGKEYRAMLLEIFPEIEFPLAGLGLFDMIAQTKRCSVEGRLRPSLEIDRPF